MKAVDVNEKVVERNDEINTKFPDDNDLRTMRKWIERVDSRTPSDSFQYGKMVDSVYSRGSQESMTTISSSTSVEMSEISSSEYESGGFGTFSLPVAKLLIYAATLGLSLESNASYESGNASVMSPLSFHNMEGASLDPPQRTQLPFLPVIRLQHKAVKRISDQGRQEHRPHRSKRKTPSNTNFPNLSVIVPGASDSSNQLSSTRTSSSSCGTPSFSDRTPDSETQTDVSSSQNTRFENIADCENTVIVKHEGFLLKTMHTLSCGII